MNLESTHKDLLVSDVGIAYFVGKILVIGLCFGMGITHWATRKGQNFVVVFHSDTECYQEKRMLKIIFQIDKIITNIIILQDRI